MNESTPKPAEAKRIFYPDTTAQKRGGVWPFKPRRVAGEPLSPRKGSKNDRPEGAR